MEMRYGYVKPCMTDLPREAFDIIVNQIKNMPKLDMEAIRKKSKERNKAMYAEMKAKGLAK